MSKTSQGARMIEHLRRHPIGATIHELQRYGNYPWKRLREATTIDLFVRSTFEQGKPTERLVLLNGVRNGKKVRVYKLVYAR